MFKISEAFAIALHSMVYLGGKHGECVPIQIISEKFSISQNHLSKVLQRLVKAGFLASIKGVNGGFTILPRKKNASFFEIYESIEGKQKFSNCIFQSKKMNCPKCIMGNFVCKANKDFMTYLKNTKISDFKF